MAKSTSLMSCLLALSAVACLGSDFAFETPAALHAGAELSDTLTPWPEDIVQLRFGVPPILDAQQMEEAYEPLVDYLSERIGVDGSLVQAEDYADLGRLAREQKIELALFTAASYVQAKREDPGLRVVLKQVSNGASAYLGYIFCDESLAVYDLEDLQDKSMCFVDRQSTSGYLYPLLLLKRRGLDPAHFFSSVVFGGNHLTCIDKVLKGECQAGAVWAGAFSLARDAGLPVHRLRLLAKTSWIPYNAVAVRSGLPASAEDRIRQELLSLSTRSPEGQRILSHALRLNAWTEAEDSDYDTVRANMAQSETISLGEP